MISENGDQDHGLRVGNTPRLEEAVLATRAGSLAILNALSDATGNDVLKEAREVNVVYELILRGSYKKRDAGPTEIEDLTNREKEILELVSEGHSNRELAKMLWVTEQTVKFHLSNIYRKLGVANRTEAAHLHSMNNGSNGRVVDISSDMISPSLPRLEVQDSDQAVRSIRTAAALLVAAGKLLQNVTGLSAVPDSQGEGIDAPK